MMEKWKKYMNQETWQKADVAGLLLFVILFFVCIFFYEPVGECLTKESEISQAYSLKMGEDGTFYVLDSGLERITRFLEDGEIVYQLEGLAVEGSGKLLLDDFAVDGEDRLYVQAGEWNGMQVVREFVLQYDAKGRLERTLVVNDYSGKEINKHKIYGISVRENRIFYAQCEESRIDIYQGETDESFKKIYSFPYKNAFNAVSDLVFREGCLWVLNKNGSIEKISEAGSRVVYSASVMEGEEERIPYRLGFSEDGEIFFTDIRGRSVQKVDKEGNGSISVVSDTDSLTVSIASIDGEERYLLADANGASIRKGREEVSYGLLRKSTGMIVSQGVFLVSLSLLVSLAICIQIRVIFACKRKRFSPFLKNCLVLVVLLGGILGVIVGVLMQEFKVNYREKIFEQIAMSAYVVANQISAEDIAQINSADDFESDAYDRICGVMERSFSTEVDFNRQIYCNVLVGNQEEAFAVAYLDQSIGTYFPLDEDETEEARRVYETGEAVWNDEKADVSGSYLYIKVPVYDGKGKVAGVVAVGAMSNAVDAMIGEMQKKVLAVCIAIMLLLCVAIGERMMLYNAREKYRERQRENPQSIVFPTHLIRLLVFVLFVAYNLSSTFLPVFLMRNSAKIGIISRDLAASLPITVNIFVIGLMSLWAAKLVNCLGIRRLSLLSGLFSMAGNLMIFLFGNYPAIFLGLLLDGIGVGLLSNAAYILITYIRDEESRMEGFSVYNGAYFSGVNFGMLLGSILAANLDQRIIFLFGAGIWSIIIAILVQIGKQMEGMSQEQLREQMEGGQMGKETVPGEGKADTLAFLQKKEVWSFIALIQNPYILFNGFIFYFVPLFCDSIGQGEVTVSILMILYSELAVFFGDFMTKRMADRFGKKAMYVAYAMNIFAVVLFAWLDNLVGMVLALVILGLSAAFGKPVQQMYFMELPQTKKMGEDNAAGIYNFTENIGESLGSVVFGRLMSQAPLNMAVSAFGGFMSAIGALHMLLNRNRKEKG